MTRFLDRVSASAAESAASTQPLRVEAWRSLLDDWSTVRVFAESAGETFCAFRFARREDATKASLLALRSGGVLPMPPGLEAAGEAVHPVDGGWIVYVGDIDDAATHTAATPLWEASRNVVGLSRVDGQLILDLLPSLFLRRRHLDEILRRFSAFRAAR